MRFEDVRERIAGVPYILPPLARRIYDFVLERRPAEVLELGFAHGASSCYIAAALEEAGAGHLTAVDLLPAMAWQQPSIEELLARTGLAPWVTVCREATHYTWFLKKQIAARSRRGRCEPLYDFCFLDGAKHWTIDGAAFFLVDKLLRPGGWLLFDDLQWTFGGKAAEGKTKTDGIALREMGADELAEPHVELIFRLLVMQHPDYAEFRITDHWWAWARKQPGGDRTLIVEETADYRRRLRAWREKHPETGGR
jgi:predicted O-methyltransferase YrrM